ncbi:hypothetical protein [Halioxenophilus sp. WMMB6]|uniref:hypothetical protein n=1 Tax=Halioxenophilus sp. WMMB6 TaxID=3073815 RepID=UPI00295E7A8F|nr:hypothetical protein [Halioxenophilus sp. WMMB6]
MTTLRKPRDGRPFGTTFALVSALFIMALAAGCSRTVVKTTQQTPLAVVNQAIPEQQLIDVGIVVFDPGLEDMDDDPLIPIFPEVRRAESHYFAVQLMDAMQMSAGWGAVRVVPDDTAAVDLVITGKILSSDGERLELKIHAEDASGVEWLDKKYEQVASHYSYEPRSGIEHDPFVGLYNRIANDLLTYRQSQTAEQLTKLRTVSELKFARDFSPEAFNSHIHVDKNGVYQVQRLPAANDPMLERIRDIRERDYLFIDTLQEYYGSFVREMEAPYEEWRSQTYDEVIAVRELRQQSINRTIAGVASVVGGVMAAGSGSGSTRAAGQIGIAGGGYLIKEGFDKRADSKMHVEALQELGDSLEADVEPHFFELEDRTVTLTGSVENQYQQWRKMLRDIYQLETGGVTTE